eukprot:scaffold6213_cov57-Skeletonema_menzelii.AAC.1
MGSCVSYSARIQNWLPTSRRPTSRLAVFALASKDSQNSSAQTSDVVPHATLFVFLKCVSLLTIICSADTPPVNERHFSLPPV